MQASNEEIAINVSKYFYGYRVRNSPLTELTLAGREFVLLLVSYELNFEIKKLDYYFRVAKKVQHLFYIPGWKLLLPDTKLNTKKLVRRKILDLGIMVKSEIENKNLVISTIQAHFLNKSYSNFLWE